MGDASSAHVMKNHKTLLNILFNVHRGVNVVHFNARSLSGNKLDYVKYVFNCSAVDVLCISETWFDSGIPDNVYSINGLRLFRNDRINKRGGGVAIYCRNDFKAAVISKSSDSDVEFINIEVSDSNTKLFVGCVYNPNRQNSLMPYFSDLSTRLLDDDLYIVGGDFNINVLNIDNVTVSLLNLVANAGLTVINTALPTRFANNAMPSLLDMFLVSNKSALIKFDQFPFISDHDLIFCSFDLPFKRIVTTTNYAYHDYSAIDIGALNSDLCRVNWSECWSGITVDDKLQWLMSTIENIFMHHVPLKSVRKSTAASPWFNPAVLLSIKRRNVLHSKWRKTPNEMNWNNYKKARNAANVLINKAKKLYFSSKLSTNLSSKQLWSNIRHLNILSKNSFECTLPPDALNDYFVPLSTSMSNCQLFENSVHLCSVKNPFKFKAVNEGDVAYHVSQISSGAVGHDGLSIKFIKIILPHILPTLTHIINHCFTTSKFPSQWKIAVVRPIAKKPNPTEPGDYRPISILPVLGKVCEKIMAEQIVDYLASMKLLSQFQSGFRTGHSCNTAMIKIIDDIRVPYDLNHLVLLCLLDFTKAFDTVNHIKLCTKLSEYFHFGSNATSLIFSYLSGRLQMVNVGSEFSQLRGLGKGVPQGSTLGPLLFSIFINDIFMCCNNATMHAFADDVQLYISGSLDTTGDIIDKLNEDLGHIRVWANDNQLVINADKSKVLPICRKDISNCDFQVMIGSNALDRVTVASNLGFCINNKLNCVDHINKVIAKIYTVLRILWKSAKFTPTATRHHLVLQLVMPHINYFCTVYSGLDADSQYRLNIAFNNVIRYVHSMRKFDHISSVRSSILGMKLDNYLKMRNLIFLHRLLITSCPGYLCSKLVKCKSLRSGNFIVPMCTHTNSKRFFFVDVLKNWNELPHHLKHIVSLGAFRTAIFNHFINMETNIP